MKNISRLGSYGIITKDNQSKTSFEFLTPFAITDLYSEFYEKQRILT
jgi:hypothetical protein